MGRQLCISVVKELFCCIPDTTIALVVLDVKFYVCWKTTELDLRNHIFSEHGELCQKIRISREEIDTMPQTSSDGFVETPSGKREKLSGKLGEA